MHLSFLRAGRLRRGGPPGAQCRRESTRRFRGLVRHSRAERRFRTGGKEIDRLAVDFGQVQGRTEGPSRRLLQHRAILPTEQSATASLVYDRVHASSRRGTEFPDAPSESGRPAPLRRLVGRTLRASRRSSALFSSSQMSSSWAFRMRSASCSGPAQRLAKSRLRSS